MESRELPVCPVETTLSLISDRWKVLILRDLFTGTKRFGELKKSLTGISQKVLTANLKDMEANGLLTRKAYPEVPPRVEYTLTETGESLRPVLGAMFDWGMDYKRKNHSPGNERVDALGKYFPVDIFQYYFSLCHCCDSIVFWIDKLYSIFF